MVNRDHWIPRNIDLVTPSSARLYDYYLGGSNNFAADRELARKVLAVAPQIRATALANRAFLRRAVRYLVAAGIRQFLDIGAGIPTVGNTHQIAQQLDPDIRVVYVDNEPVAVAHSELLLSDEPNAEIVEADFRDPAGVLDARETRALLDFDQPIGLLLCAVLHYVPDADRPAEILASYREALAPGSHVAITHITGDDQPDALREVAELYATSQNPGQPRSRDEFTALFAGFEVVEPGVVYLDQWRPERPEDVGEHPERSLAYGAVGRLVS
ncbi:SAM-dependent methyltransferase [Goodfellowiella coeruleoviolacea]|nr:SAM-dependent methyltransferase [Goodfellowiella coeruleoviolacea]